MEKKISGKQTWLAHVSKRMRGPDLQWSGEKGSDAEAEARGRNHATWETEVWGTLANAAMAAISMALGDSSLLWMGLLAAWAICVAAADWSRRRGEIAWASWAMGAGASAVYLGLQWFSGSAASASYGGYVLLVVVGGLADGRRLAAGMAALCAASAWGMELCRLWDALPGTLVGQTAARSAWAAISVDALAMVAMGVSFKKLRLSKEAAKKARAKADRSSADFDLMFNLSPEPMALSAWNAGAQEVPSKSLAKNVAFGDLFAEEGGEAAFWKVVGTWAAAKAALADFGEFHGLRALFDMPSGASMACEVGAARMVWREVEAVVWTCSDVGANEEMRRGLLEMNASLEAQAAQKAGELAAAQKELTRRARLARLGGMIAGVAHEINTPIGNAMLAASSMEEPAQRLEQMALGSKLSRSELSRMAGRVAEAAEMAVENIGKAAEVVKSFKQLSADQAGQTRREFTLAEALGGALKVMASGSGAKKVKWTMQVDEGARDVAVDGYPGAVSEIAGALMDNALKHAFEGVEDPAFVVRVVDAGPGRVKAWFQDNGSGLAAGMGERAFDPFVGSKKEQGSAGLGLSIAEALAREALGGSLSLEPSWQGCCFVLEMPTVSPMPSRLGERP